MTFPVVETTNVSEESSNTGSHTVNMPASVVSGELVFVGFGTSDDPGTVTWPSAFTQIFGVFESRGANEGMYGAWAKGADVTGSSTVTVSTSNNVRSSHVSYRISGAEDPDTQPPEAATANDTNGAPNPPSLSPTGGAKDYLWLAVGSSSHAPTYSAFSTSYINGIQIANDVSGSATRTSTGGCQRQLNASSEDPSVWSSSEESSAEWVGATIAIHPSGAATATLVQTSYRIRTGDTVGLNTDSGWEAALNTAATIDAGGRFRIRFTVTETAAVSVSTAYKLQFRRKPNGGSFGSWTDCPQRGTPVSDMPVQALDSGQYADGDSTTAVLSSGAGFVAGDGNENINTASVTLDDEHTEFEFCVMLLGTWGGPARAVTGDILEFRLVLAAGTALNTYTNTPSITVSMPNGYLGPPTIESPGRIGTFCDTNGNLYEIIEPVGAAGANNNEPEILKSSDGGDSRSLVDIASSPTENDLESVDCFQDGDTLHIIIQDGGSGNDVTYHTFRLSDHSTNPDTWGITDESITASPGSSDQGCGIVARGDGTVVAFYRYNDGSNERVGYKIRSSGGVWGSQQNLDNTASTDFTFCSCVLGASDKTHVFYRDQTNNDIYHKSLSSGDSLSGRELVEGDAQSGSDMWGTSPAVYWDDAGDEKVMILVRDDSDGILYSVVITNDGSPEARKQVSGSAVRNHPTGALSHQPVCDLVVDPDTDTAYALFAYSSDGDLYLSTAANDGGWGTDEKQIVATNIDYVRGQIFTHSSGNGGAKVYGYVYEDDGQGDEGFSWYTEYEIAAAATKSLPPIRRTKTYLRM